MHKYRRWVVVVAAVAVWSAGRAGADKAAAPPEKENAGKPEMVPHRGAVRLMLLRQKSVQEELKIKPETAKKINDFALEEWEKAKAIHDLPAKEQEAKYEELSKANNHFIQENLSEQQRKRLNQIGMQVAGLLWVTHPELAKELNLTEQQKARAEQQLQIAHREMQQILQSSKGEVSEERVKEERRINRKRLQEILTDQQKARWTELAGEKFTGEFVHERPKQ
jgi:hypothetical protein